MKNIFFGALVVLILLFGCINTGTEPTVPQPVKQVKVGDTVFVDYVLQLEDKTIIDTSVKEIAQKAGIYSPTREYTPLTFTIGENAGLIKGFVYGVIGMKVNETKQIIIEPEDGYGAYDQNKVYDLQLYYNITRYFNISRKTLEAQGQTIFSGNVINTGIGTAAIEDFDNDTVMLRHQAKIGQNFTYNGIPQQVVNMTNDTIFIKLNFEKDKVYTITSSGGIQNSAKIMAINETDATLNENHPLAGKKLYFTIVVLGIA